MVPSISNYLKIIHNQDQGSLSTKNVILRSYLGRNILVDMHPMVELHTTLVIQFPVRA